MTVGDVLKAVERFAHAIKEDPNSSDCLRDAATDLHKAITEPAADQAEPETPVEPAA